MRQAEVNFAMILKIKKIIKTYFLFGMPFRESYGVDYSSFF